MKTNVCAVFDVGKTNKKAFLFDESYRIVWEHSELLTETQDEDGDPCEDLNALINWVLHTWQTILQLPDFEAKAVNFSTYGASFVHLDAQGRPLTPLYNYLKPYPDWLQAQYYDTYGGAEQIAVQTASPVLGSLNSGMQIYRLKHQKPAVFEAIRYCLHLPQYLHYLLTHQVHTDITSVGCHTNLWDFAAQQYHAWVSTEHISHKLPDLYPCEQTEELIHQNRSIRVGTGLHDSSSALIPYLINFQEPFVLLSTGTWCISINPFNEAPLTFEELQYDCLCYLTYQAKPVKASRLFAGYEHEAQTKRLALHFGKAPDYYKSVGFDAQLLNRLRSHVSQPKAASTADHLKQSAFGTRSLSDFATYEEAYHQLMLDLMRQQLISTELVLQYSPVKRIFVDGGFSKNPIFMHLLAEAFPKVEVYAAEVAQASALGAALVIHPQWNTQPLPPHLISLNKFT